MKKIKIALLIFAGLAIGGTAVYVTVFQKKDVWSAPKVTVTDETLTTTLEKWQKDLESSVEIASDNGKIKKIVEQVSGFTEDQTRTATIAVADAEGHVTKVQKEFRYEDYQSPRFHLTRPLFFSKNDMDVYGYMSADDVLDGDLTYKIKMSGLTDESLNNGGNIPVEYRVTNSAGDTTILPVTLTVQDEKNTAGEIGINLSEYLVNLRVGDGFDPVNYLQSLQIQNNLFIRNEENYFISSTGLAANLGTYHVDQVQIDNPVDTGKLGVYEVSYRFSLEFGESGMTRLIVVVNK